MMKVIVDPCEAGMTCNEFIQIGGHPEENNSQESWKYRRLTQHPKWTTVQDPQNQRQHSRNALYIVYLYNCSLKSTKYIAMSRSPNLQQKGKKSTEAHNLFLGIQLRGYLGPIQPSPAGTTSDNGGRVPIHIGVIFLLYIALKAVLGPERAAAAIKVAVIVVCVATFGLVA